MTACKHTKTEERPGDFIRCADCRAYLGAVARAPKPEPRRTPLYWVVRVGAWYLRSIDGVQFVSTRSQREARRFTVRTEAARVAMILFGRVVAIVPRARPHAALVAAARKVVEWAERYARRYAFCASCFCTLPDHGPHCPFAALAAALGEA